MKEHHEFAITDDVISLYRNKTISENEDLRLSQAECFDIILNKTQEIVGVISYRYSNNPDYIDYSGNINYRIKENFRGNGYAKRALELMVEILKKNTKYNQPLYVASPSYNEDYLKVVEECGGKLIHSGLSPKHIIGNNYDREMKDINVYRIDIEKTKEKTI